MPEKAKKSLLVRLRNYFITGAIVLIPIGITIYLTLFIIKISSNLLPKQINPNNYLPFDIPGIEILITIVFITIVVVTTTCLLHSRFHNCDCAAGFQIYSITPERALQLLHSLSPIELTAPL